MCQLANISPDAASTRRPRRDFYLRTANQRRRWRRFARTIEHGLLDALTGQKRLHTGGARWATPTPITVCTANVFDVSMFTELDGLANDWLRNRSQSSWLLARNAAPTAMIERIDSPPRQGGASPGCIVPQPALDPSPSHRAHHARDYL